MQTSIKEIKPEVKPFDKFTVTLTVETLEEALALRALFGAANSVADAARSGACHVEHTSTTALRDIYRDAFSPLDSYLRTEGLI